MALVSLNSIRKAFGANVVLDGITFQIEATDRIGLIGSNGSGKTTLLRVIAGSAAPDAGAVKRARSARTELLAQEPDLHDEHCVHEAALAAFKHLISIEKRLKVLEANLSTPEAVGEHAHLLEEYERGGGYTFRRRTDEVLEGLSFRREMFERPVNALSGGEKSRVALARLLLTAPEVLLLDEATNHLDIEGTEWLESFLGSYPGAVVFTSHDRYFLDRAATRIIEIGNAKVQCYKGNYSAYVEQKQERLKRQTREYEQQQEFIAKEKDYIRRNIAAQNVAQARGRRKRLERLERVERPNLQPDSVRLEFQPVVRSGERVLLVEDLGKNYGKHELFGGLSFEMQRGDRVGIVGPNGAGKTTLLKLILGIDEATSGRCTLGHKVQPGYYSQQRSDLDPDADIMDQMWSVRPTADATALRGYLGRFLFSGDNVFKRVGDLSGGEQARVALARLILAGSNLLVLDEPTNHLDIESRSALERALLGFDGTILLVTHDRFLLNRVARKVLAIGYGTAKLYNSRYADCEEKIRAQFHPPTSRSEPETRRKPRPRPKSSRKRKRIAKSLNELERLIIKQEEELSHNEWRLADPQLFRYPAKAKKLKDEHAAIRKRLDELNAEWEVLVDEQVP